MSTKTKKRSAYAVAAVLVLALLSVLMMGIVAYLTDAEQSENTFTVGSVNIDLVEPEWPGNDSDDVKNVNANHTIPKDPRIINTGLNDALVFATIEIPKKELVVAKNDGTRTPRSMQEIALLKDDDGNILTNAELNTLLDNGWIMIASDSNAEDVNTYTFAYSKILKPEDNYKFQDNDVNKDQLDAMAEPQIGTATTPLFTQLRVVNVVEGEVSPTDLQKIKINSYAIQAADIYRDTANGEEEISKDLENKTEAELAATLTEIYNVYLTQKEDNMTPSAKNNNTYGIPGDQPEYVDTDAKLRTAITRASEVRVDADIELDESKILNIPEGSDVSIDLGGHTLTVTSAGARQIKNEGSLNIENGYIVVENEGSYGAVDNYGTLTMSDVSITDNAHDNGSALRVRSGSNMIIDNVTVNCTAESDVGDRAMYIEDGGSAVVSNSSFSSKSTRAYCLIVGGGNLVLNDTDVSGIQGGLAIDAGDVVVNGGTYSSQNYYGIWVTNDGSSTTLTVNDGDVTGKAYGLYGSVDDGNQDMSDCDIQIHGGKFTGNTDGAKLNKKNSENNWVMVIDGGSFSSDPSDYLATGCTATLDGGYYVVE